MAGLLGLVAALSLCLTPGLADAKKQRPPRVATFNLYLGTDLPSLANKLSPTAPGNFAKKPDSIGNAIGFALNDVDFNNFGTRAAHIANVVRKRKVDLIGLQEAALWKIQSPTDASGLNPAAERAIPVLVDYTDSLLTELNKKARTKRECGKAAKKRKAQGKKPKPCYRGYRLGIEQDRFDSEFLGDFDNSPGPNGKTFDLADSPPLGAAAPGRWLEGNDDTGLKLGEPEDLQASQCSDGKDNDGDGLVDYGPTGGVNETSGPPFPGAPFVPSGLNPFPSGGPWDCESRVDDSEVDTTAGPGGEPVNLPRDQNFDHHVYAGNHGSAQNGTPPCPAGAAPICGPATFNMGRTYDAFGNGLDAPGFQDCASARVQDTSSDAGPAQGSSPAPGVLPPYPFAGYDGDQDPNTAGSQVPVCLFHGLDGDLSLTMRDAILVRKGAGIKARNATGALFNNQVLATLPTGQKLSQNRGWLSMDVNVRGKSFKFVNTHLEATDDGTVREDQATELINGPLSQNPAILVGDLNSDERSADPQSPPAMQRLLAAGFRDLVRQFSTSGHLTGSRAFLTAQEPQALLNNPGDLAVESRIDHILTNGGFPMGNSGPLDRFARQSSPIPTGKTGNLWLSDHVGVFATLGGKPKKKKKK